MSPSGGVGSAGPEPYVDGPGIGAAADDGALGGKGAALRALSGAGFPVPRFFCVTTRVLQEIGEGVGREVVDRLSDLGEMSPSDPEAPELARRAAEAARTGIRRVGLTDDARTAIEGAFDRCFEPGTRVAVRSSVVGEDSADDSFAGQMDTYLFVSRDDVPDRVLDCLGSAFSERALLYRHAREIAGEPIRAGVVIQEMVMAVKSGVAFTADPVTNDPSRVVVSAGLGLGEGVVGDLVEVDTYQVDKADGRVRRREVVTKRRRVVPAEPPGQGTRMEEVPESSREAPVLSDSELAELVELAGRVEGWRGAACDIEWCVAPDGGLRLLQCRPVTGLSEEPLTILDNSNIVESYPGVSSPLTFTFVRRGYAEVFREGLRILGVSEAVLDREETVFRNLVAYVDGRIYYNILHWYRLFELMGLETAVPAWERALGLTRGAGTAVRDRGPGLWRRAYIRARIGANLFLRRARIDRYLERLASEEARLRRRDLTSSTPHELLELLDRLVDRLLAPYGIAVVNDLYAQQLYDLTGRLVERWRLGDPDSLRNALLVGGTPSDSVLPVRSLAALADEVRANPRWLHLFETEADPETLRDRLRSTPELQELRDRLQEHLEEHGDRTLQELKLETPSLREEPAFALRLLRSWVVAPREDHRAEIRALRRDAEDEVRDRLRHRPLRRMAFSLLLRWTREAIRHRENLRLARTRAFGLVKRVLRPLASDLHDRGLLDDPEDVFLLTLDEVEGAVRGHSVQRDLGRLVALRREERARNLDAEPPPRIVVRGPVQGASPHGDRPREVAHPEEELRGQGCSRGVATGPATVVRDPRGGHDVTGRILVAPMTDPGWVFLMVAARGLVVEKGSMLSHTAIVGRELGIPTVVAVEGATRHIADGDLVRIDGAAGTVRVLERAPDGGSRGGRGGASGG